MVFFKFKLFIKGGHDRGDFALSCSRKVSVRMTGFTRGCLERVAKEGSAILMPNAEKKGGGAQTHLLMENSEIRGSTYPNPTLIKSVVTDLRIIYLRVLNLL